MTDEGQPIVDPRTQYTASINERLGRLKHFYYSGDPSKRMTPEELERGDDPEIVKNRLIFELLKLRRAQINNGFRPEHFGGTDLVDPGDDRQTPFRINLDSHDANRIDGYPSFHSFSENQVMIHSERPYQYQHTTLRAIAEAAGVNSLAIVDLIGTPDRGYFDDEEFAGTTDKYPQRLIVELKTIEAYLQSHPEDSESVRDIRNMIALRLVKHRKVEGENKRLRIGSRTNTDGSRDVLFMYDAALFHHDRRMITDVDNYKNRYAGIHPTPINTIVDQDGNLNPIIAAVPETPAIAYNVSFREVKNWNPDFIAAAFRIAEELRRDPETGEDVVVELSEEEIEERTQQHVQEVYADRLAKIPGDYDFRIVRTGDEGFAVVLTDAHLFPYGRYEDLIKYI